jgi:hypothetical protein
MPSSNAVRHHSESASTCILTPKKEKFSSALLFLQLAAHQAIAKLTLSGLSFNPPDKLFQVKV